MQQHYIGPSVFSCLFHAGDTEKLRQNNRITPEWQALEKCKELAKCIAQWKHWKSAMSTGKVQAALEKCRQHWKSAGSTGKVSEALEKCDEHWKSAGSTGQVQAALEKCRQHWKSAGSTGKVSEALEKCDEHWKSAGSTGKVQAALEKCRQHWKSAVCNGGLLGMAMLFEGFGDISLKLAGFKVTYPYQLESTVAFRFGTSSHESIVYMTLYPLPNFILSLLVRCRVLGRLSCVSRGCRSLSTSCNVSGAQSPS